MIKAWLPDSARARITRLQSLRVHAVFAIHTATDAVQRVARDGCAAIFGIKPTDWYLATWRSAFA